MSISLLNGRFVGLRVRRKIANEDKPRVRYFSFRVASTENGLTSWREVTKKERTALERQARELDAEWAEAQRAGRVASTKPFDPFAGRTNTGIKGLSYGRRFDGDGYEVEGLWISVRHDGRPVTAGVRSSNLKWKDAWRQAVTRLAEIKGLDKSTLKKMIAACPQKPEVDSK